MHKEIQQKWTIFTTNQNFGAADTEEKGRSHLNPEASRLS